MQLTIGDDPSITVTRFSKWVLESHTFFLIVLGNYRSGKNRAANGENLYPRGVCVFHLLGSLF